MNPDLLDLASALLDTYRAHGWRIATAESCTGGLVAACLTEIAGSSDVVERGFVTYSNEAKSELIGVSAATIAEHGAVSEPVARAMAKGALAASRADAAVSLTGVAGPGGGSEAKPVGLVHLAVATRDGTVRHLERRYGALGRAAIREAAVADAFAMLRDALTDQAGAAGEAGAAELAGP